MPSAKASASARKPSPTSPRSPEVVAGFRTVLKGGLADRDPSDLLRVERSWAHGHVAAVLGTCRSLGLERILHRSHSRSRDLALAAVVARVLAPDSKFATARRLSPDTADSSLGALLGLGPVSGNELLAMLDWLLARRRWIETSLANRHLSDATLILYDVSSSYVEGRLCPLAAFGYNRDGKKGKLQVVFGLLCSAAGCPLAMEVFPGNTADPTTLGSQVQRIRKRFGITRIALVGDRGMLTTARLREDLEPGWTGSKTMTRPRRGHSATLRSQRLRFPNAVGRKPAPSGPRRAFRRTVSRRCWRI